MSGSSRWPYSFQTALSPKRSTSPFQAVIMVGQLHFLGMAQACIMEAHKGNTHRFAGVHFPLSDTRRHPTKRTPINWPDGQNKGRYGTVLLLHSECMSGSAIFFFRSRIGGICVVSDALSEKNAGDQPQMVQCQIARHGPDLGTTIHTSALFKASAHPP